RRVSIDRSPETGGVRHVDEIEAALTGRARYATAGDAKPYCQTAGHIDRQRPTDRTLKTRARTRPRSRGAKVQNPGQEKLARAIQNKKRPGRRCGSTRPLIIWEVK